jgi:hypothetical protein
MKNKKDPKKVEKIIDKMSTEQRQELFNELDQYTGKSYEIAHEKKVAQERRMKEKRLLRMKQRQASSAPAVASQYPIRNRKENITRLIRENNLHLILREFRIVANEVKSWVESREVSSENKESIGNIFGGISKIEKLFQVMDQAAKITDGVERKYSFLGRENIAQRLEEISSEDNKVYTAAVEALKKGPSEISALAKETISTAVKMEEMMVRMREEEKKLKQGVESQIEKLPVDKQPAMRRLISEKVVTQALSSRIKLYKHFQEVLGSK